MNRRRNSPRRRRGKAARRSVTTPRRSRSVRQPARPPVNYNVEPTESGWQVRIGDITVAAMEIMRNGDGTKATISVANSNGLVHRDRIAITSAKSRRAFVRDLLTRSIELDERALLALDEVIRRGASQQNPDSDGSDLGAANTSEESDDLPVIPIDNRRLTHKTRDAVEALAAANARADVPTVYVQGAILVRRRIDDGVLRIEVLGVDGVRHELDRHMLFVRRTERGPKVVDPPLPVARDILAARTHPFPPLRAVAQSPFFTRDSQLILTPGYHANAGVLLTLPGELVIPAVPPEPSADDVAAAKTLLFDELLVD